MFRLIGTSTSAPQLAREIANPPLPAPTNIPSPSATSDIEDRGGGDLPQRNAKAWRGDQDRRLENDKGDAAKEPSRLAHRSPPFRSIISTPAAASSLSDCCNLKSSKDWVRFAKTLLVLTASALAAFEGARLVRHRSRP